MFQYYLSSNTFDRGAQWNIENLYDKQLLTKDVEWIQDDNDDDDDDDDDDDNGDDDDNDCDDDDIEKDVEQDPWCQNGTVGPGYQRLSSSPTTSCNLLRTIITYIIVVIIIIIITFTKM